MAAQQDPYVRVYYRIVDDPKFATVYDDDAALSLWLRLLLVADATYPMPAPIPHGTKRRPLARLVEVGLVDEAPGGRFRMHGMASERDRRSDQARAAAGQRWQSGRNATASGTGMHSEPSNSEPSHSTPSHANGRATPADPTGSDLINLQVLAEELTGQPYALVNLAGRMGEMVRHQLSAKGLREVERTWRSVAAAAGPEPTIRQIVLGADDALFPVPRMGSKDQRQSEHEAAVRAFRSGS